MKPLLFGVLTVNLLMLTDPKTVAEPDAFVVDPKVIIIATIIHASTSMSSVDCGGGLTTYTGSHGAAIVSLNEAHVDRTWTLRGEMHKCDTIFFSKLSSCDVSGVARATRSLSCTTRRDFPCELEVKGKSEGSMSFVTSHTAWGYCFSRHCDLSS